MTFDGIAKACAQAMGKPEPELVHFNPKVNLGAGDGQVHGRAVLGTSSFVLSLGAEDVAVIAVSLFDTWECICERVCVCEY